ncbi:MAG: TRAP transporter small permease subunit [Candidatus Limnocylindria bacterium]
MAKTPVVDRVCRSIGDALSLLFLVAVVLTCYEVVMRYAFNAPTIWVHDVVIMLSAVCFVAGGAVASQRRSHIQMASFADKAPPRLRRALDRVCHVLTALYLGMFLHGALQFAVPSVRLMETSGRAWDVPIPAFLKAVLALGIALMLAQTLSHIRHRAPQAPPSPETVV